MHEDELIQRVQQGDAGAANELVERFYPEILRYCLWHAPNASLAEDAAQETFLKVIRYFDRYVHKGTFKPFLYRIAANTCVDMSRKHWRSDVSLEDVATELPYVEPGIEHIDAELSLKQMVSGLPPGQQEIVLLRFGQDLTIREIAQAMDLPLRTVQSRLRSALKQLKQDILKQEGTL